MKYQSCQWSITKHFQGVGAGGGEAGWGGEQIHDNFGHLKKRLNKCKIYIDNVNCTCIEEGVL